MKKQPAAGTRSGTTESTRLMEHEPSAVRHQTLVNTWTEIQALRLSFTDCEYSSSRVGRLASPATDDKLLQVGAQHS